MRGFVLLLLACLAAAPCWAQPTPGQVPGPLIETANYAFVPDPSFAWRGPQQAAGVLVWAHGRSGRGIDDRDFPAPPFVKVFNDAGWDIVRFNRAPMSDTTEGASRWLHDGLPRLRAMGWQAIVAAGQSRGAWNSLQLLDTPGLADTIIAIAPAAHGSGATSNLGEQTDDLRAILSDIPRQNTRVAFVQFSDDVFSGSEAARSDAIEHFVAPEAAAVLILDRPPGFSGHGAGYSRDFAQAYGACLLAFATAPTPPTGC